MLRTLRSPGRPFALRRLVAMLLAFVVLGTVAEPLIAEAHDGDATGVVLAAGDRVATAAAGTADAAGDADRRLTPTRAASEAASVESVAAVVATAAALDAGRSSHGPVGGGGAHGLHVCHCAHVHGGLVVAPSVLHARLRRVVTARPPHADRLPARFWAEPRLRPPILPPAA